ncbi:sigma-54 interaction domain-containing protein [Halalkalibacter krulwichiae]|uniref:Arginine utilization regulatory protein RocR n=2 Tax=Halalkalibacter krulwichiae TaxID=199441 RepID=A0A1X9MGC7_9BACI|nr:sigma 54-interacting transcriptional regulator [Halalkalibacter krulwichiae]ARK30571.1 Arginine utilization regulatory protein RocR [Halalkalibacter krulwichiae]
MFLEPFETKQMLEAILGSIDEGIHVVDSNGITIYYNQVAANNDGVDIVDVLGKHVLEVFPSLNKQSSTLLKVIENGDPIYQQSQSYKNIKGQFIDTVNTTLPIKVGKKTIGAVEIAKDLTRVRKLSQSLLELQGKVHKQRLKPVSITGANYTFDDIVTTSNEMYKVKELAKRAAHTSSPVMIYGETGTGKELLIQSIHNYSPRKNNQFIAQNCATLPASLLESTLFGTKKGSFTGSVDRAGLFELAHNGTLFLDEINTMSLEFQSKLLRVLEDGVIRRVGGTEAYAVDVRMIVAMNEHPHSCIEKQLLRSDLYYRLNVIFIEIPPLRKRIEDIPLLVQHFIKKYNNKFQKLVTGIDETAIERLMYHQWPGNIRELEHSIEFAMNLVEKDKITIMHLPQYLLENRRNNQNGSEVFIKPLRETLEETEVKLITDALKMTDFNILKTAKILEIPRQTLQYKMKKFQLIR